jgi:hypothetical protein
MRVLGSLTLFLLVCVLLMSGCAAIGDIEAPVLRADDSGSIAAPESDSSEAGIHAEGDAGMTGEIEAASLDSGFDSSACTYHWSFCAGVCEPQLSPTTPEACYCVPTCACLEAIHDFNTFCPVSSPPFTGWQCVDMPMGAQVTCTRGDS